MSRLHPNSKVIDRADSADPPEPESFSAEEIEAIAISRSPSALADSAPVEDLKTISDVISERIWPFYSNWLQKPLGPCSYCAIFGDESTDGPDIDSVWIVITTKFLVPSARIRSIMETYTYALIPDMFKERVELKISQGTITCSATLPTESDGASSPSF
jgi:hypothetical protein